ncbi:MAG: gamma-glutamyltransferase [Steroidobacteraceae bacterium]
MRFPALPVRTLCLTALLFILTAQAAERAPGKAAIASAHPLATQAGLDIIKQGGNAFDAAIAVTAALAVVEPQSSGLGGGGFYLLHRAADQFETMVDARETAPAAASRDMFLDASGEVIKDASRNSALAAGIPGEVAGMAHIAERYGRLPLSASLQPAIKLARDGFPLYPRMHAGLAFARNKLADSKDASSNFLRKGEVPAIGTLIRQPQLANTLELIAREGADGFYQGKFARQLVAGARKLGGIWSEADLASYRVVERAPIKGSYRGALITSAPPPSAGGIALLDALNILSGYDLNKLDSATRKHLIIEALRRAYRDRAEYLGDPDFISVPVNMLTSPWYAAGQRSSLRLDKATASDALPGISDSSQESPQTTHFSILDTQGNRVAATITVNLGFGSGLMVDGTGFFLNNEMDDFSVKPGAANAFQLVGAETNAIAPGKRMLSSMTPTFVETGKGILILGTPGGSRITSMVLLGILDWLDGNSAVHVVALPRFHHQYLPDEISFEKNALTDAEQIALRQRGHHLREAHSSYGNMEIVTWDYATGIVEAASDPRGEGVGWVY